MNSIDEPGFSLPPFARHMGMTIDHHADGVPVVAFDYGDPVMGRPGFLHGGALGGLMEIAAIAALRSLLADNEADLVCKPVNITVTFMRGGREQRTFALGRVTRLGRTVANVETIAWQDDPDRPIANSLMNFVLSPPSE